MRSPVMLALAAALAIALWIVLTFVMTLRTGWTHLLLVAGVLLIVVSVVELVDSKSQADNDSA